MLYDSHMHTPLCKHAKGMPEEYAQVAYERGLTGIIFTCHNPLPDGISENVRMLPEQFEKYQQMVKDAQVKWEGKLDVRFGLECDYLPDMGLDDWLYKQTKSADFDYILGSIHPHLEYYKDKFWNDNPVEYQKIYFDNLVLTAQKKMHDCLSHPDLVKNMTASNWNLNLLSSHIKKCLDKIADTGIAMELNTSGWNKALNEQMPSSFILEQMALRNIPVVLGSDSHEPKRVGARFSQALGLLEKAGFSNLSFFLKRKRYETKISEIIHGANEEKL